MATVRPFTAIRPEKKYADKPLTWQKEILTVFFIYADRK